MPLSTASITSVDDFSPISVGDTHNPLTMQFWTWSAALNKFVPQDLTNLTISMKMQNSIGTVKVCAAAWIHDDDVNGKAHYPWNGADVDTAGVWSVYITLTDGAGKPAHVDVKTLQILSII